MSVKSTKMETRTVGCGHEVPEDSETLVHGDMPVCKECYIQKATPGMDEYPDILSREEHLAHDVHGTRTEVTTTSLIGVTKNARAVYYNALDNAIWFVVPEHSPVHVTEGALRNSLRYKDIRANEPGRPTTEYPFLTMANGDHLCLHSALYLDSTATNGFTEWFNTNEHRFREVRDEL